MMIIDRREMKEDQFETSDSVVRSLLMSAALHKRDVMLMFSQRSSPSIRAFFTGTAEYNSAHPGDVSSFLLTAQGGKVEFDCEDVAFMTADNDGNIMVYIADDLNQELEVLEDVLAAFRP
jgi:hypothetical protein